MCLKGIAFTLALDTNNKMLASQKNSFSSLVRDQNLSSRFIFHLQQPSSANRGTIPRDRFSSPIASQISRADVPKVMIRIPGSSSVTRFVIIYGSDGARNSWSQIKDRSR